MDRNNIKARNFVLYKSKEYSNFGWGVVKRQHINNSEIQVERYHQVLVTGFLDALKFRLGAYNYLLRKCLHQRRI